MTRSRDLILALVLGAAMSTAALVSAPLSAATSSPDSTVASPGKSLLRTSISIGSLSYLPALYYSTQNGFGAGGAIWWPISNNGNSPSAPSTDLILRGRITTKTNGRLELTFEQGWGQQRHSLRARLSYENLGRRFYGIGPDTPESAEEEYRPERLRGYLEFFHRFTGALRVGMRAETEHVRMLEVVRGGLLETGGIPGTSTGNIFGGGLLLDWSTRDRKYSPTAGTHHQAFVMKFKGNGSDNSDFLVYMVDLRKYFALAPGHVFAAQIFMYGIDDDEAPFWRLASLGGREHSRGYHQGRYLDRVLLSFQGEYRATTLWRLGLVAFAGLADVAPSVGRLKMEHMRPTIGGGIRFRLGSEDSIRGRFDAAVGEHTVRFYLQLDEAF